MMSEPVILRGETALHLLRKVSLETLREIVTDLGDAGFGDDHVFALELARQILDTREQTVFEAADTMVTDVEWDD